MQKVVEPVTTVRTSIRIAGPDVDPDRITALLEVVPTQAHRRGDPNTTLSKCASVLRYSPFSSGIWILESSGEVSVDAPVEAHLDWAEHFIRQRREKIVSLQHEGFAVDVFVGCFTSNPSLGLVVDLAQYPTLCELGISVGFDCYFTTGR